MLTPTEGSSRLLETKLEICTVLFGGLATLRETLPTWISAVDGMDVVLRIIDNGPTRDAEALLRDLTRDTNVDVIYIHAPENPGFAASANRLIREAATSWAFLLNPDVYLHRQAVISVLEYIDGAEGPAAVSICTDGKLTAGICLTWYGFFLDRQVPTRLKCLGPSGGAAIIPTRVFYESGWDFDEDLFAWGEDAGLAIRLFAAGVQTNSLNLALDHLGGHSVSSLAGQRLKARLLARNRLLILRRDFTVPFRFSIGLLTFLAMLANGLRKVRSGTGSAYFGGMLEGLRAKPIRIGGRSRLSLTKFIRYSVAGIR